MYKNITVNMENLNDEEKKQLLSLIEESNRRKRQRERKLVGEPLLTSPGIGTIYWIITYVSFSGELVPEYKTWHGVDDNIYNLLMSNAFKTEEDCKFAIERLQVERELKLFADEHNDPELEEWDGENEHWYIEGGVDDEKIYVNYAYRRVNKLPNQIYFTSSRVLQDAIEEIGEERIKKYYIGMED